MGDDTATAKGADAATATAANGESGGSSVPVSAAGGPEGAALAAHAAAAAAAGNGGSTPSAAAGTPTATPTATAGSKKARAGKRVGGVDAQGGNRKRTKTVSVKKNVPALGAYAKLEGKNLKSHEKIVEYVTQLPTTLGRTPATESSNIIGLGQDEAMDAEHAVLDYDAKKREFTLRVVGASGALVNGRTYDGTKQESAVLQNKDPVRIADACFYFLLPTSSKPIKPTLTYAELAEEAFARVGKGVPMSTREIAEVLRITYAYFQDAPGLAASLQQAMRRSKAFVRVGVMKTDKSGPQRHAFLLDSDDSPLAKERRGAEDSSEKPVDLELAEKRIAELQDGGPPANAAPPASSVATTAFASNGPTAASATATPA
ncbi:FHA domain-containing protein FHA1 [Hondaea fermentalgiana]|uniref:FHA domain-containing protein FHA1 n=1 Tax=Hondaea fermentalgiana TaxID=2315210 RepID=A0A2R5GIA0_9STRA|nr:FHA domain-containing protein FHA1 [Hondaea fermentalgiana]|eukprot:GBG30315.1 FHA domain-containing protein FHA1 [Hondaea fermentalgiana]